METIPTPVTLFESNSSESKNVMLLEQEISNERTRLSSDRIDISFGEILNLYKNKELIIRPEYQRLYRWSSVQKTAFIESLLLNIPIPPIFVAENENGVWELVDGLQRVTTFITFFGELQIDNSETSLTVDDGESDGEDQIALLNKWVLVSGSLLKNLEGFTVDTLPNKFKINLRRTVCRVEVLRSNSAVNMKYELFKRLNSNSSPLTPQEIRNAIYRGINPKLNDFIVELSKNELFMKLTALSQQKRKELYNQELVLKFIAYLNNVDKINDNKEGYLDDFMDKNVDNTTFDFDNYRYLFTSTLSLIDQLEDPNVFKTMSTGGFFIPAQFEGIMVGVAQNFKHYENNLDLLRQKINILKQDPDFKKYSGTASNSKSRIKNRLGRALEIFNTTNR